MSNPSDPTRQPTSTTPGQVPGQSFVAPSLPRRLAAMLYDSFLLLGVLMLAEAILVIPYEIILGSPYPHQDVVYRTINKLYLLIFIAGFYGYFWTHGGQTLGMRTWRFRLVRTDGLPVRMKDALRRLAWAAIGLAPAGLGLWWCLLDRDRLAWYDRRSGTRPVRTDRPVGGPPR